MDALTLSIEDLYEEISDLVRSEGVLSREEWNDFVDEFLEEKRSTMKIEDEDDWQYVVESLQAHFDQFSQKTEIL
jgi:polyhydroxyalkanoate synthesis regulator phasin